MIVVTAAAVAVAVAIVDVGVVASVKMLILLLILMLVFKNRRIHCWLLFDDLFVSFGIKMEGYLFSYPRTPLLTRSFMHCVFCGVTTKVEE